MLRQGTDERRQVSCCGGDWRVTQIRIGNAIVGLVGLKEIFERLYAANGQPDPEIADSLLAEVKAHNYVAPGDEEDYRAALLREYTAFWAARQGR